MMFPAKDTTPGKTKLRTQFPALGSPPTQRAADEVSEEALRTLQVLANEMMQRRIGAEGLAGVVQDDPDWADLECTRRHVALMWVELNESVTAEVGSALVRRLPTGTGTGSLRSS